MASKVRQADSKGRVAIPGFANATVIVEKLNNSEYLVKKARVIPERDLEFEEEMPREELSQRDAVALLNLLENPPAPTEAALEAAKEFMKNYGRKNVDDWKADE